MNKSSLYQKSDVAIPEPKLVGLPRSMAGALIGMLFFIILVVLSESADLQVLNLVLLIPGFLINLALIPWRYTLSISASDFLWSVIAWGIPAITPAILGSLFVSRKKEKRIIGIIVLVLYFAFSLFAAYSVMD